ncbi:putative small secreted protein [Rosellinia necatrix]|uniref:Putative small secreted protein n=1 Tax=Rosellinia necatrix TaxID=77044 RepID=A0A1W2TTB1_ROSNE|nr:putative small secreted protein [Rosellinia necatrix]
MHTTRGAVSLLALPLLLPQVASLQLNVTAIGAENGSSTLECWQMDQPFITSTEPGTAGSAQTPLGGVSSISYSILPPDYDGGIHNAPANQWVVFTAGLAHITLPDDNTTSAYVVGGQFGLIFAADTLDVSAKGHRTVYPGITETIALQVPTLNGEIPKHQVLHAGPCSISEIAGIREYGLPA